MQIGRSGTRSAALAATKTVFLSMLAFSILGLEWANADECKLSRVASLDLSIDHGEMFIPVSIGERSTRMLVETGGWTALDPQTASDYQIPTYRIQSGYVYNSQGVPFKEMADVHSLVVGQLSAKTFTAFIWPTAMFPAKDSAGSFGSDFLRNYDVDFDLASRKFGLFSQDHCPGKVVYWTSEPVAVVPMHVTNTGHIIVQASLDGHPFDAILDTGASHPMLSLEAAQNTFGLGTDQLEKIGETAGAVTVPVYKHTFKTLGLEGVSMANPTLFIRENLMKYSTTQAPHIGTRLSGANQLTGVTDLTLGLYELRNLHVYIAYKEQKLYISSSSAVDQAAASTSTPRPAGGAGQ